MLNGGTLSIAGPPNNAISYIYVCKRGGGPISYKRDRGGGEAGGGDQKATPSRREKTDGTYVVGVGRLGSGDDFFVRCAGLSVGDVVPDASGEEDGLLRREKKKKKTPK